jgi:hypothetical protein
MLTLVKNLSETRHLKGLFPNLPKPLSPHFHGTTVALTIEESTIVVFKTLDREKVSMIFEQKPFNLSSSESRNRLDTDNNRSSMISIQLAPFDNNSFEMNQQPFFILSFLASFQILFQVPLFQKSKVKNFLVSASFRYRKF